MFRRDMYQLGKIKLDDGTVMPAYLDLYPRVQPDTRVVF